MKTRGRVRYGVMIVAVAGALAGWRASDAQNGNGAIEGSVLFHVELPEPDRLKVTRNADVCGANKVSQEFVVSAESRGLKNVVVWLSGPAAVADSAEVRLDQKGCTYHPHVQVTTRGAKLTVTNSDATFHNVHAYHVQNEFKRPTLFNIAQPAGSEAATQSFVLDKTGVIEFNCDVHEWMTAYVIVHENSFFAVTDDNGGYSISNVPPGDYTLTVWHEGLGSFDQPITVETGETVTLDFPIEGNY